MTTQPRPCLTTLRMMGEPRLALLRAGLVFPLSTSRLPAHPLHGCSDGTWRIHEGFAAVSVVVALRSQRRPAAPCRPCSFTIHTPSGLLRPVPAPFRALQLLLQRRAGLLVLGGAATTFEDSQSRSIITACPARKLEANGSPTEQSINMEKSRKVREVLL